MASSPTPPSQPAQHAVPGRIVIATRESRLALWQAEHVQARLRALYPACSVELLPMTTRGDELQEAKLALEGGKGLFIKELEVALTDGRADLAVHSMKDVPVELPAGFAYECGRGSKSPDRHPLPLAGEGWGEGLASGVRPCPSTST